MSSPTHRSGSGLLRQEEAFAIRGGTLATLIRRRSSASLFPLSSPALRDEEEGGSTHTPSGVMTPAGSVLGPDGGGSSGLWRREAGSDDEDMRRLHDERRLSAILNNPQMRSMRLIGKAKRYRWERYWKTGEELAVMKKSLREYYERNNMLIQQYLYIDRLLNSSLPHDLLNEYNDLHSISFRPLAVPVTIPEEPAGSVSPDNTVTSQLHHSHAVSAATRDTVSGAAAPSSTAIGVPGPVRKVKRTPKAIYRPAETTPLLGAHGDDDIDIDDDDDHVHDPDSTGEYHRDVRRRPSPNEVVGDVRGERAPPWETQEVAFFDGSTAQLPESATPANEARGEDAATVGNGNGDATGTKSPTLDDIPQLLEEDENIDSTAPVVTLAIYINLAANVILLAGKTAVVFSVPSISVLASLVDAMLDFLSTAIVWTTTWLISNQDQYRYPVGRRRLEPLGVLVFSVIMITSFVQVMLQAVQRLASNDQTVVELGLPALIIMLSTIVIKGLCWLWCRLVKNSSVQALAADAATDVVFNAGSIAFPIVGFYARIWWLDALGGLILSMVVIYNWSRTSIEHIKQLSGFSATADQRNILLYLTMRFAKTIRAIQGLQAYHGGDKLIVEVDIVLDANMSLKDSHDLSESLQYVIESVPIVDRAFVHADYADYNLPTHMEQQAA